MYYTKSLILCSTERGTWSRFPQLCKVFSLQQANKTSRFTPTLCRVYSHLSDSSGLPWHRFHPSSVNPSSCIPPVLCQQMALQSVQHPQMLEKVFFCFFSCSWHFSGVFKSCLKIGVKLGAPTTAPSNFPVLSFQKRSLCPAAHKSPFSHSPSLNHPTSYKLLGTEREKTPSPFTRNQLRLQ